MRNRGNFAIGKQPEISITSYGKWNDYEQDSFNFSIQYLNFQYYGTGENSTPKFAELNDDVLFGEVWSRTDKLGLRDRSLVTVTSLISQGITDNSLIFHLQSAKKNGITRTEIAEIITHIGFYAGWPKAWAAFNLAKDVWAEDAVGEDAKAAFQRGMI